MTTIREFVTANNITLPPIATRDGAAWDEAALAAELAAYTEIVAAYNASGQVEFRQFLLGRLGVMDVFGPVAGLTILSGINQAAQSNPVIAELLTWMAPGAPGVDIGNAAAGELLSLLASAEVGVLTSEQKAKLDGLRTKPVIVDELDAWNELHTWIEGRPV